MMMSSSSNDDSPNPISSKRNRNDELAIVYRECLKNHAASLGGNARDGCGEFMSSVENRLNCSACGCHRNFHRREVDVYYWSHQEIMQCHPSSNNNTAGLLTWENDGEEGKWKIESSKKKKRHRTKFTREQKEKMFKFAEKAEWKIQKLDEREVQQFCKEVDIQRRVLKVWMHNNKQHRHTTCSF